MKIDKLTLKNFGSYEDKTFTFERVKVILDKNGAGKSTILKALNFALDGDYEEGMVRVGEDNMTVTVMFEGGLVVSRHWKNGKMTHKVGVDKPKAATKEVVNQTIAKMAKTSMDKLKVIASSSELFQMKPDALAEFFMSNIPKRMNADMVISYISDINPMLEQKARSVIPATGEFGQEEILRAYNVLYEERRDLARDVKADKTMTENYDFSVQVRGSKEIQADQAKVLKRIGELEAHEKQHAEWLKLKGKRQEILTKLHQIQNDYRAIQVMGVPEDSEERKKMHEDLKTQVKNANGQVTDLTRNIASITPVIKSTREIIERLKEGMCPQLKGMKCPNDWTGKIHEFQREVQELARSYEDYNRRLEVAKRQLLEAETKLGIFETNNRLMDKKIALLAQFNSVKPTLPELPEEPKAVGMHEAVETKTALEKELKISVRHEQLLAIRDALPAKEERCSVLDKLVAAFSPKGEIMEKNLQYYLDFFEKQVNTKAESLGYVIHMETRNGLRIQVGKKGCTTVDVGGTASGGEKAVALFLLLDLFNSITGVNLLFLDEVEVMDAEVFEKLLALVKERMDSYDHIILAGVDHTDTLNIVKKYFN